MVKSTLVKIALVLGIVVALMGIVWMARGWWGDYQNDQATLQEFYHIP
jgi:hypothetical protein